MKVSTISTADFIRGGASQKNLRWLQAVADNLSIIGFDALDVTIELASFDNNTVFSSIRSITDQIDGMQATAAIAALWCLKENGHIDLQMIDGEQFLARRLLNGGQ